MALLMLVTWYAIWDARRFRFGGFWEVWAPSIVLELGMLMLMVDPTRHLFLEHGGVLFELDTLKMYASNHELTPAGKFSQIMTIAGFAILVVSLALYWDLQSIIFEKLFPPSRTEASAV